ncbi:CPBP family glutamic-type intramembrane protease [Parasphingorhabdus cellanae]|uniref:CPBP family intramembrane metalloprotease n=1 Tax=Parasphingorhabdus cellanae TaxID=2806553 RepID=A0ABX7T3P1_9SPHN|nr:CPBP family glutamic-type intramembrane protease [Parasphingorhabdus cellanae]QTD54870.1 CPBP family intramembrane metalloprotease [Parasphingorhabdus cellanae]
MFEPNSTIGWATGRLTATTHDLLTFLRAPKLPDNDVQMTGQMTGKPSDLIWLFLINCMIVAAIAIVLFPIMLAFDVSMSNSMAGLFQRPVWQLLLIVVIAGPIVEELMFRSWLSGSPRLLIPFFGLILWMALTYSYEQLGWPGPAAMGTAPLLAVIAGAVLICVIAFWKRPVPRWYVRIFPLIFWIQALLFGSVHIFNYAGDNPAALLPFVLPQTVGGLIWGYARIRYGWWTNIVMHMAYNLIATSGLVYVLLTRPELL